MQGPVCRKVPSFSGVRGAPPVCAPWCPGSPILPLNTLMPHGDWLCVCFYLAQTQPRRAPGWLYPGCISVGQRGPWSDFCFCRPLP